MGHDTILNSRRGTPLGHVGRYEGEDVSWKTGRVKKSDIAVLGMRRETEEKTLADLKRANAVIKIIGD